MPARDRPLQPWERVTSPPVRKRRQAISSASDELSADAFRRAMRELGAGVTIVTTLEGTTPHGLTATAVMSIAADPPTLAVCVNRSASAHDVILRTGMFAVNVLPHDAGDIATAFASSSRRQERFSCGTWSHTRSLPALAEALARFDCRLAEHYALGTHTLLIGDVEQVAANHGNDPLLYFDGQFGSFRRIEGS